jgi:cysteine desulfurase/selenocysteine lyase
MTRSDIRSSSDVTAGALSGKAPNDLSVDGRAVPDAAGASFDIGRIRRDFPILRQEIRDKPLTYLDNAATTQKPQQVIEAVARYYFRENANIHRGVHYLSQLATEKYEGVRASLAKFIGAGRPEEIIFVRGATEAINLVASTYGRQHLAVGDEILVSHLEHHSNIVPWQMLCESTGAVLRVIPIDETGQIDLDAYRALLSERTRLVAFAHISNALGTILPVQEMTALAKAVGAAVLIDGAQGTAHSGVDVQTIGCDFYAISAHKMYGPTGIGALYGRHQLLEEMPPYQGGGDMIASVSFEKTTYHQVPHKFEAGTPNIAGVLGFGAAIDYLEEIGLDAIAAYENELLEYATERVARIEGVRLIGTAKEKASIVSFTLEDVHPHDFGTFVDQEGVAVRVGHHCAQPVMERFGIPATIRASFGLYNDRSDVDRFVQSVENAREFFA